MQIMGVACTDVDEVIKSIADGTVVEVKLDAIKVQNQEISSESKIRMLTANDMRVKRTYIIKVRQYTPRRHKRD